MDWFPTDVSLRIKGDLQPAEQLLGIAKNLLHSALNNRELQQVPVLATARDTAFGSVRVLLSGPVKIVEIVPAVPRVTVEEKKGEEEEVTPLVLAAEMVHGVINVGNIILGTDEPPVDDVLHEFWPTQACADVYSLPFAWQDIAKLAVRDPASDPEGEISQYQKVKPGMFSGTMKRVVQVIFGLGIVADDSPGYFADPTDVERPIPMQYDYKFDRTHGAHQATDGSWWLIEISDTNGVLACPLPIFLNTTTADYYAEMDARGDTDTVAVLDQFGGLPSGEPMPTGAALAQAIADGLVLQLLTAGDLAAFYDKTAYTQCWGWAFNSDGTKADNTCYAYEQAGDYLGYAKGYHYSIAIAIDATITEEHPAVTGTAELTLVSSSIFFCPRYEGFILAYAGNISAMWIPDPEQTWYRRHSFVGAYAPLLDNISPGANGNEQEYAVWFHQCQNPISGTWDPSNIWLLDGDPWPPSLTVGPQIDTRIGNVPVFVFYRADDTLEVVRFGETNMQTYSNRLFSDTIDYTQEVTGAWAHDAYPYAHTMLWALQHCREGWAAYTIAHKTITDDPFDASTEVFLDLYTAQSGIARLTPPAVYSTSSDYIYEGETIIGSEGIPAATSTIGTALGMEFRIGMVDYSNWYPLPGPVFDINENCGPTYARIRHNTMHFPPAPPYQTHISDPPTIGTPIDHSGESFVKLNPDSILLDAIAETKKVNWVGNV